MATRPPPKWWWGSGNLGVVGKDFQLIEPLHRLLRRQALRAGVDLDDLDPAVAALLLDVSRSYEQSEADRALADRVHHLAQQELELVHERSSERFTRLESVLSTLAEGIAHIDAKGRITFANRAFREFACRGDVEGQRLLEVLSFLDADGRRVHELPDQLHGFIEPPMGMPVRVMVSRTEVEGGSVVAILDVQEEWSAWRAAERAALESERAQAADAAKSSFLASLSHEFRTPLNGVVVLAQLFAEDTTLSEEQRERAEVLRASGEALLALVGDVLDLSRIESGRVEVEAVPTLVADFVREVSVVFGLHADSKELAFVVEVDPSVPPALMLDRDHVRQVMINLLGNALKFTSEGTVSLRARWDVGSLVLEVRDTGPGIPEDRLEAILEPFTQVSRAVTRQHGGTGLGLAISLGLVQAMGGNLSIASTVGEGSTFTVVLPAEACDAPDINATTLVPGTGMRVLLVDDNPVNRLVAKAMLKPAGLEIVEAEDAEAALALALDDFDLVLLDVHLPGMSGLEAAQIMKERGVTAHIVAVTANATTEMRDLCVSAGMDGFLTKPLRREQVTTILAEAAAARELFAP
ncbi:MAG: response regulator [Deltaproteobacteria bacterium]|nr:MAG: response regulator [Deltaproteobacteria bacterium]